MKKKAILLLGLLLLGAQAQSATYLARVVSRANCGAWVPFLGGGVGWYNESVSYDWIASISSGRNHMVRTESYQYIGGRLVRSFASAYRNTWRSYAGKTDPLSDKRFFYVAGRHWEFLDGARTPFYRETYATGCNLI